MKTDEQTQEWERYATAFPGRESVSGPGSTLEFTQGLRAWLPELFEKYSITSILDAPCGDWNWMRHVDLAGRTYLGWDVQQPLIDANLAAATEPGRRTPRQPIYFECVNLLTRRKIPQVDLIICRDMMAHLENGQVSKLLGKFQRSGSRYLLATNFPGDNVFDSPYDRDGFRYRAINLEAPPFNLTGRLDAINEPGPEKHREMVIYRLN